MLESHRRGCTLEDALAVVPLDKPPCARNTHKKFWTIWMDNLVVAAAPEREGSNAVLAAPGRVWPLKHAASPVRAGKCRNPDLPRAFAAFEETKRWPRAKGASHCVALHAMRGRPCRCWPWLLLISHVALPGLWHGKRPADPRCRVPCLRPNNKKVATSVNYHYTDCQSDIPRRSPSPLLSHPPIPRSSLQ